MQPSLNRVLPDTDMATAEARTRAALATHGFGVLTEIDVQATMKAKLDKDLPGYRILGACNPQIAFRALQTEPRIGVMMPCNVILRAVDGGVEVSAVDLTVSWGALNNPALTEAADAGRAALAGVLSAI